MGSVSRDKISTGSAMIATMRQIGMSCGIAITGAIFASRQTAHLAQLSAAIPTPTDINKLALVASYQDAMLISAIVCILAVIASSLRGTTPASVTKEK